MLPAKGYFKKQNQQKMSHQFPTTYDVVMARLEAIEPLAYAESRNFLHGHVTRLSPYISRGVLSTRQVVAHLKKCGHSFEVCEKLVQELCWRDYFQRVWQSVGDDINADLSQPQQGVTNYGMIESVVQASTGVSAIDKGISQFYETGYMHNHLRMYIASIVCNHGGCHWQVPAKWMYYHLLDGDWASNACSWQWVSGAFSKKKYYANQTNINKFMQDNQSDTFLDTSYDLLPETGLPAHIAKHISLEFTMPWPPGDDISNMPQWPVLIYNWYNLDPLWHKNAEYNRVLLLEPSVFSKYPISLMSLKFMLELARNIKNIKVFIGEFEDLQKACSGNSFIFKEHPLNVYVGKEEKREFVCDEVTEVNGSFFSYWKKVRKAILKEW